MIWKFGPETGTEAPSVVFTLFYENTEDETVVEAWKKIYAQWRQRVARLHHIMILIP